MLHRLPSELAIVFSAPTHAILQLSPKRALRQNGIHHILGRLLLLLLARIACDGHRRRRWWRSEQQCAQLPCAHAGRPEPLRFGGQPLVVLVVKPAEAHANLRPTHTGSTVWRIRGGVWAGGGGRARTLDDVGLPRRIGMPRGRLGRHLDLFAHHALRAARKADGTLALTFCTREMSQAAT